MPQQTSTLIFESCSWVPILQEGGLGKVRVNCFPKAIATWHGRESNPRPPDLESDALTTPPRCPFMHTIKGAMVWTRISHGYKKQTMHLSDLPNGGPAKESPEDPVGGLGKVRVKCFPKAIATWHGRESNPRPPDLESDALTTPPRCPSMHTMKGAMIWTRISHGYKKQTMHLSDLPNGGPAKETPEDPVKK
ncbi:hypothetical protein ElyMa_004884700 [Elysia marginata]|uniref:Uncharacterized protein n=1 Tax=Elysia marginata TaxID=1093978 RepID=A0AAV4IWR5_9GAST|nr:hypothetical protein ElyMa_004884700 [Elysia marginata]